MASKKRPGRAAGPEPGLPSKARKVSEILRNARETLDHAEGNLTDFLSDDPKRQKSGLRNFIVSARSVTFVLQTLKHTAPGAEDWYADLQGRLKLDPVAVAFVELRNRVEKEGVLPNVARSRNLIEIGNLSSESLEGIVPSGVRVSIGEARSGGNFWTDRNGRRHYFDLPEVHNTGGSRFEDVPAALANYSVEVLVHYYFELMEKAVIEAMLKFGHLP